MKTHCVAIILEDKCNNYILQLRDNNPNIAFPNMWALIAGLVESGENPEDAIRREAREELKNLDGSEYELVNLKHLFVYQRKDICRDEHVFHALMPDSIEKITLKEGQRLGLFNDEFIRTSDDIAPHHKEILISYATEYAKTPFAN